MRKYYSFLFIKDIGLNNIIETLVMFCAQMWPKHNFFLYVNRKKNIGARAPPILLSKKMIGG